jgi:hypothetical protein
VPTAILSNGTPEMLQVAVKSAGMHGLFDHVLSVDAVRKYKTAADAYALARTPSAARPSASCSCRPTAGMPPAPPGSAHNILDQPHGPRQLGCSPTVQGAC